MKAQGKKLKDLRKKAKDIKDERQKLNSNEGLSEEEKIASMSEKESFQRFSVIDRSNQRKTFD